MPRSTGPTSIGFYGDTEQSPDPTARPPLTMSDLTDTRLVRRLPAGVEPERVTAIAQPLAGPSGPQLEPGQRIGQFELIRELGRGGMGQVYLARDTRLARLVALKFLRMSSPGQVARFLVEARTTAQCRHDNIVVIYDADEWEGMPYLALEYLQGRPLSAILADGTLHHQRAIAIMTSVVRALVCAHELGIVHRDLKPDNIFVTSTGQVKVLDFGIAKLFGDRSPEPETIPADRELGVQTETGALVGTVPYMSPEQWGAGDVDHRTDLWAIGVIFWEALTGCHPLTWQDKGNPNFAALRSRVLELSEAVPSIAAELPTLPAELIRVVDSCLVKPAAGRVSSAVELLRALERIAPARAKELGGDECPYPGMICFEEDDASRFFGRDHDVRHVRQRLTESPMLCVVGPSGVGKSSFVRAGVMPALRSGADAWQTIIVRPGRKPLQALLGVLQDDNPALSPETLRQQPGALGTLLRARADQQQCRILLFIDQFEELYTLGAGTSERQAFTDCLAGVADHASTPLRLVVSMRSDLLDRAAENRSFMEQLSASLFFLTPISEAGMRDALLQPLALTGYQVESESTVDEMITQLRGTPAALPLLQFVAAKLWDARDRERQLLTVASYQALGGIAGALASYADDLVGAMTAGQQRLARAIFERLVTPDGTKAVAERTELEQLSSSTREARRVLATLAEARLVVMEDSDENAGTVEIVHESLLSTWPTLRRWREESAEDGAFREELRAAARQWHARGHAVGLLWRAEAAADAARFAARCRVPLPAREQQFLDAVIAHSHRLRRVKRVALIGTIVTLLVLATAATAALLVIRDAQKQTKAEAVRAQREAAKARAAESKSTRDANEVRRQKRVSDQRLQQIRTKDQDIATGKRVIRRTNAELEDANRKLKAAIARTQKQRRRAQQSARDANEQSQRAQEAQRAAEVAERKWRALYKEKAAQLKKLEKLNRRFDR